MLLTKLHIPTLKGNLVYRRRIFDKLDGGLSKKLILISAPAGYGKTTILLQWIKKNQIPTAWLSLDARDNAPNDFLSLLLTSIQTVQKTVGERSLDLLKPPATVRFDYMIELLINDLLETDEELLLVLDDFHTISSEEIVSSISFLLEYKPKNLHVAILTRSDPVLPLARYRSQNEIVEIRFSDLYFSQHDVTELFNKNLNLGMAAEDIRLLDNKIEGWIAGLQLVALTIQDKRDKSEYVAKIAGDNRYVMDYLMEEVLNVHDEEMRRFLLFTSVLDRFCASLCDAILEKKDSQLLLESLERNNTFIIPLDNERKWFRYHHLFGDLLRKKLATNCKDQVAILHKRASTWFGNNNLPLFAIEHAIAAEDRLGAMCKINSIVDALWETSRYASILSFGSYFSEKEIISNKNFGIIYAWSLILVGELEIGEQYLRKLEDGVEDKKLLGRIYETFSLLKVFAGDVDSAFHYSTLATQYISKEDIFWKTWSYISRGELHLLRFELDYCVQSFEKARQIASKLGDPYLKLVAEGKSTYVLKLMGRYSEAYTICNDLLATFREDASIGAQSSGILSSILYSIIGFVQIERNNVEEGFKNALTGFELTQKAISLSFKGYGALLFAESCYKVGRFDQALKVIEGLEDLLVKDAAQWLTVLSNSLKSKLLILQGDINNADILHSQKIRQDKNHAFEKYFYHIAIARLQITQHKCGEALDLLEQLTQRLSAEHGIELLIEVELLKARAHSLSGSKDHASNAVLRAILFAQKEGLVRTFINEGEPIKSLIKDIAKRKLTQHSDPLDRISKDYLTRLETAFKLEDKRMKLRFTGELSTREIEVLKLVSNRLSNNEISNALYISLSTVKTHMSHILSKLGAHNRREAIEIGIEKGLL